MNIFEDLIDELKKDNLLEATVIETSRTKDDPEMFDAEIIEAQTFLENFAKEQDSNALETPSKSNQGFSLMEEAVATHNPPTPKILAEIAQPPVNEAEFYRKRATDEVSCLQIVEHILSGVEREQMNVVPKPYDELEVKKSLHAFLQVSKDINSPEHAQAEFQLMQETESWYSALSHRDKHIPVAHLRRFCETTRPALSSPALVALARFYRNSPYSESVRNKFDFVVTRLFSNEIGDDKREVSIRRTELIENLTQFYAEWESISAYANEENDSKILITTLKFEDFMAEADGADNFDELVRNDFFNRLRGFKEGTLEQFFVPLVTATAIECNIKIGNRYIELLEKVISNNEAEKLENKYGFLHDQVISDAVSKTLQLVELLKLDGVKTQTIELNETTEVLDFETTTKSEVKRQEKPKTWYSVNKWLLAATILAVLSSISIFIWSKYNAVPEKVSLDVKVVNLDNSSLKEFIKEARINKETFYAVVLPNWNESNKEKKEDVMKKILAVGAEKGFKNVFLLDQQGKPVGTASEESVEIY